MKFQNLHTHTTYCDGTLTPEGMIEAALSKGCDSIGFSEHACVPFDIYYSMDAECTQAYIHDVNALKQKYEGVIEVFLGLEQDYYSSELPEGLDYTIGALHYVQNKQTGEFVSVDAGANHQKQMVDECFGGDYYALAEEYFSVFSHIIKKTKADIVGHFDLVAKYNINNYFFDEQHPRYVDAALSCMDEILKDCRLFEVNSGAMFRLGKLEPYPSAFLLKALKERRGEVILSSDSHDAESICYKFDEIQALLKICGFDYIKRLTASGFVDVRL
ncbi:MAG: histidinol-phosphatase [Oscillospiraceae bacterium]|nr:histidinol-phosphatase [Oscillospiraceae bacterium]